MSNESNNQGQLTIGEVLGDYADRIEHVELAVGEIKKLIDQYQEDTAALQIASMLVLLRAVNVRQEDMHKEITNYLDMGRMYAKNFIGEKTS